MELCNGTVPDYELHPNCVCAQDHYFYERGHEAVDREMPLGKRLYPILKK